MAIRRHFKASRAFQLTLVVLVLLITMTFMPVSAEEGADMERQQHEESPPVQEEAPPTQGESPQPQEVVEQEVQTESPPPVEEEEPPLVEEETPKEEEEETPDDSWFELNVFECKAPQGDPIPPRVGPVSSKAVMALCFRPQNEDKATLKSIDFMEYSAVQGPTQKAINDNAAAGAMTRIACPMPTDSKLCITATKLDEAFFSKSYATVAAQGKATIVAGGVERIVPFEHKFSTQEAPKQELEHNYFEFPTTPPPFPCGKEIRIWVLMALILTLLEFAFSPDSESLVNQAKGSSSGGEASTSSKKKKNKKE